MASPWCCAELPARGEQTARRDRAQPKGRSATRVAPGRKRCARTSGAGVSSARVSSARHFRRLRFRLRRRIGLPRHHVWPSPSPWQCVGPALSHPGLPVARGASRGLPRSGPRRGSRGAPARRGRGRWAAGSRPRPAPAGAARAAGRGGGRRALAQEPALFVHRNVIRIIWELWWPGAFPFAAGGVWSGKGLVGAGGA